MRKSIITSVFVCLAVMGQTQDLPTKAEVVETMKKVNDYWISTNSVADIPGPGVLVLVRDGAKRWFLRTLRPDDTTTGGMQGLPVPDTDSVSVSDPQFIGPGTQPHCAAGAEGTLHITYKKNNSIWYVTLDTLNRLSTPQIVPNSDTKEGMEPSNSPWIFVDKKNHAHIVWDRWENGYYNNYVGNTWKQTITLPRHDKEWISNDAKLHLRQRNWKLQVSGGYEDEVYVSSWNTLKGVGDNNTYYKITNTDQMMPHVQGLEAMEGDNRPPSILGPSGSANGDGTVHTFTGRPQTIYRKLNRNFTLSDESINISLTPVKKTGEGCQAFFIGNDIGFVTTATGSVIFNTLSRAKMNAPGMLVDSLHLETVFPRAAYDPVKNSVYVLYPNHGHQPVIAFWKPRSSSFKKSWILSDKTITYDHSDKNRGPGAGGIAPHHSGGVHIIYSIDDKLYHQVVRLKSKP